MRAKIAEKLMSFPCRSRLARNRYSRPLSALKPRALNFDS
jgi:hypothetical protein